MPSKRVIVLERLSPKQFRVAFWADVPAARQKFYANASLASAYKDIVALDLTALQSGAVTEMVQIMQLETTIADFQAEIQTQWARFQADITDAKSNSWNRYGTSWDGSAWTIAGVN